MSLAPRASGHVHLGSFAAGAPLSTDDIANASGTAIYSGHAFGNVYNAGAQYSALGTFNERFNFGNRTGETTLAFDGAVYTGASTNTGAGYASDLAGPEGTGRTGTIAGAFSGPMTANPGGGTAPAGIVAEFRLQNASTDPSAAYRATGTAAAEKR